LGVRTATNHRGRAIQPVVSGRGSTGFWIARGNRDQRAGVARSARGAVVVIDDTSRRPRFLAPLSRRTLGPSAYQVGGWCDAAFGAGPRAWQSGKSADRG